MVRTWPTDEVKTNKRDRARERQTERHRQKKEDREGQRETVTTNTEIDRER